MRHTIKKALGWLTTSIWAFPLILLLLLLTLTVFKINGSSVGIYHKVLYGPSSHDPNLLFGQPREIRTDEWLGATQETIAQSKSGYHRVSPFLGKGRDVSLQADVPSRDWSTLFKPHNWSFFILPLEQAFAFKWWLLLYSLIISCYFFTLRVIPDKKWLAILFAISAGLSPFALWWYQTSIFMGLTYGFLAIILGMRLLNGEPVRFIKNERASIIIQILALGYIGACFGLILYPPFQIPIAIVVLFYLLGHLINKWRNKKGGYRVLLRRTGYILTSGILAGAIGIAFIMTHHDTIHKLTGTIYPGQRIVHSGDLDMLSVFDGFLMPLLQGYSRGAHFFANQSEAANFIMLLPFLLVPAFALLTREYRKKRRIDWIFLLLQVCGLIFLIRAFVPYGQLPYKLLLLDRVPNKRLVIGMGFVGFLLLVHIIKKISDSKIPRTQLVTWSLLYGLSCFVVLLWTGSYVVEHYPMFVHSWLIVGVLAASFSAIIVSLLAGRTLIGIVLLFIFTIGSSFCILPIYRGLGFVAHSKIANAIDTVSKPDDRWASMDNIYFENIGLLAGRDSISGIQIYPDLKFWEQAGGKKYEKVYNREGHVLFTDNPKVDSPLVLVQPNLFEVRFNCSSFITNNIDYVASTHTLNYRCASLVNTTSYPNTTFYLYKVTP